VRGGITKAGAQRRTDVHQEDRYEHRQQQRAGTSTDHSGRADGRPDPLLSDVTWTGTIAAGGMGPGTPPMTATGTGTHQLIQDGRWIVGTYSQDQYLADGTFVLTWQLHWVIGWDPQRAEYRATLADNYGHADVMHGHIEGDRLIVETAADSPVRLRMTWDATDPAHLTWRNQSRAGAGPWTDIETYHLTPVPD
jgi:Protein of unknown function (DUF1579)